MKQRGTIALATKLFGSGAIAQLCGFAAMVFAVTRTSPTDFALFAAVTAGTAVLGSVNSLAAESRVPVVELRRAQAMVRAGFTTTCALSTIALAFGLAGLRQGSVWGEVVAVTAWCSLMLGIQHLFTGIVLREQAQELLARSRLVQGASNAAILIGALFAGFSGRFSLNVSWGISLMLGNVVVMPRILAWRGGFCLASREDFNALLGEVRWQPLSNLLSDGVGQIPLLALPALNAPYVNGAWAVANRFLSPIINMAQLTLQPIYYGRAAELLREGSWGSFMHHRARWSRNLLWASVPFTLACAAALYIVIPMLGPQWSVARLVGIPACLVFPMALSWLPISQSLILSGHLRLQFLWTVGQFLLSSISFLLVPLGLLSPYGGLLAWACVSTGFMATHRLLQRLTPRPPHPTAREADDFD